MADRENKIVAVALDVSRRYCHVLYNQFPDSIRAALGQYARGSKQRGDAGLGLPESLPTSFTKWISKFACDAMARTSKSQSCRVP